MHESPQKKGLSKAAFLPAARTRENYVGRSHDKKEKGPEGNKTTSIRNLPSDHTSSSSGSSRAAAIESETSIRAASRTQTKAELRLPVMRAALSLLPRLVLFMDTTLL